MESNIFGLIYFRDISKCQILYSDKEIDRNTDLNVDSSTDLNSDNSDSYDNDNYCKRYALLSGGNFDKIVGHIALKDMKFCEFDPINESSMFEIFIIYNSVYFGRTLPESWTLPVKWFYSRIEVDRYIDSLQNQNNSTFYIYKFEMKNESYCKRLSNILEVSLDNNLVKICVQYLIPLSEFLNQYLFVYETFFFNVAIV